MRRGVEGEKGRMRCEGGEGVEEGESIVGPTVEKSESPKKIRDEFKRSFK